MKRMPALPKVVSGPLSAAWLAVAYLAAGCCGPARAGGEPGREGADAARTASIDLPGYVLEQGPVVVQGVEDNLSGIAVEPDSGRIFVILNNPASILEITDTATGEARTWGVLDGFEDMEDLACLGRGRMAVVEERRRTLVLLDIPDATTRVNRADCPVVVVDEHPSGNSGLEGVAWDAAANRFIVTKEKEPQRLYLVHAGPAGELGGARVELPWDAESRLSRVKDLAGICNDPGSGHWLVLSEESRRLLEITPDGREISRLKLAEGMAGLAKAVPHPEGVAMDRRHRILIASEPNLLYVFAPRK